MASLSRSCCGEEHIKHKESGVEKNTAVCELLNTSTRFIDGLVDLKTLRRAVDQAQAAGATGKDLAKVVYVIKDAIGWEAPGVLLPVPMFHGKS